MSFILPASSPKNDVVDQLVGGARAGINRAKDFAQKVGLERESSKLKRQERAFQQAQMMDELINHGVDPDTARLYTMFTTGGQTEFAKDILEQRRRGLSPQQVKKPSFLQKISKTDESPLNTLPSLHEIEEKEERMEELPETSGEISEDPLDELESYLEEQDVGLTPRERIGREAERFKINQPIYAQAGEKLKTINQDRYRIKILESLNESKKLPKHFGRLNLDKEGNLKFPFAASPEAQRYIKTLNEFSAGAKDTYGSRVTNFELGQFLKRYPNLLNTEEGRRQIIQQMKIINDINSVHYKNLKKVYDKAGGIRRIDPDAAERIAEQITAPQVESLIKRFEDIGPIDSLPSAEEHKGRRIKNKKTGEILESNGIEWIPSGG